MSLNLNILNNQKELKKKLNKKLISEQHPFHILEPSVWPFVTSWTVFFFLTSVLLIMKREDNFCLYSRFEARIFTLIAFCFLIFVLYKWFGAVVFESRNNRGHSFLTQQGIRYGMVLFILSEVMFFFSFFWSFFHISLSPSPEIRCIWPPLNIEIIKPWAIPLLNTLILIGSGVTITVSHYCLKKKVNPNIEITSNILGKDIVIKKKTVSSTALFLKFTIILGLIFTLIQGFEYADSPFSYKNNIYGSLFFLLTGFHGFHVIIGTIFLIVCYFRLIRNHFTFNKHVGYECAIWYWHFVDVVWLFLFGVVYVWGGWSVEISPQVMDWSKYPQIKKALY